MIGDPSHDAIAHLQSTEAFRQIHGAVDLNRARDCRRTATFGVHRFKEAVDGRPVLVIRDTYEWTGGGEDPATVDVYRVSVVDRDTGEVLGRWHSYERFTVRSVRTQRVWIQRSGVEWPDALAQFVV